MFPRSNTHQLNISSAEIRNEVGVIDSTLLQIKSSGVRNAIFAELPNPTRTSCPYIPRKQPLGLGLVLQICSIEFTVGIHEGMTESMKPLLAITTKDWVYLKPKYV